MKLVGKKLGMTRHFTEEGVSLPITVIEILPNRITQIKTNDNDGYRAIQVTTGTRKASRVNKPMAGHFKKAGTEAGRGLWELPHPDNAELKVGDELTISDLKAGQIIDVTGTSKGKGFAGVIKRHNFGMQDATHGNSRSHRVPGSIGQNQTPGRVFKGKKMAGHMGAVQRTVQNLEIVRVDAGRNVILVRGAIPGCPGSDVIIKSAVKLVSKTEATA